MADSIIRVDASLRHRYAIISKLTLEDSSISHRARGLLCWLLAKPDDWTVVPRDLHHHCSEGRDACVAAMRELISAGYIIRRCTVGAKGTPEYEYTVMEERKPGNPAHAQAWKSGCRAKLARKPGNPQPGNPQPGNPAGNRVLSNTENTEQQKQERVTSSSESEPPNVPPAAAADRKQALFDRIRKVLEAHSLPPSDRQCRAWGIAACSAMDIKRSDADQIATALAWIIPLAIEAKPDLKWPEDARPVMVERSKEWRQAWSAHRQGSNAGQTADPIP